MMVVKPLQDLKQHGVDYLTASPTGIETVYNIGLEHGAQLAAALAY
jgi:hypothetical protein